MWALFLETNMRKYVADFKEYLTRALKNDSLISFSYAWQQKKIQQDPFIQFITYL